MMDTSAFLALAAQQQDALLCKGSLVAARFPQYVTSGVLAETHRRLLFDRGREAATRFLAEAYGGAMTLVRPDEDDESDALRLIRKYADLPLTFCDALTCAVMFRLGIKRAFTYDRRHFLPMGFVTVPPLDL